MADFIDRSGDLQAADARAKRLLASLERANKRAEEFAKLEQRDSGVRRRLTEDLKRDIKADRIKGETIGEREATPSEQRARARSAEARATREQNAATRERIAQERQLASPQLSARQNELLKQRETIERRLARSRSDYAKQLKARDEAAAAQRTAPVGSVERNEAALNQQAAERKLTTLRQRIASRTAGLEQVNTALAESERNLNRASLGAVPPSGTGGRPPTIPGGGGQRLLPSGRAFPQLPPPQTVYGAGAQPVRWAQGRNFVVDSKGQITAAKSATQATNDLAKAQARATAGAQAQATAGRQLTLTQAETNKVLSGSSNALAQYSTQLRRHGALTTEFISAAARGNVTIRELGYQVGSTIGKFGGWLVAGAAVFTALDAVRQLGTGAIDSSSGVNQLQRVVNNVNADDATRSFRELSKSFNLPIDQVTDAAYQMGKVFHDQNDALEASKAVLYSVKVGELDTATASRYLISIVNGFHLPASKMAGVFDQVNAAQNNFGASIPDVLAGLAKASGTYRAAGGDLSHLLAILVTAQKVTGNTGQVIGTAIARAPRFIRSDEGRATLESFGINAGASIDQIVQQAFEKSQHLSGKKIQLLAEGIFGPQYGARIGTPLLSNFKKYQEVLQGTSPQAAKGSAERELNTLLGSVEERIAKIGITLQNMGSNLASAGFLTGLKVALGTLQALLDAANSLLEVFNRAVPQPFRDLTTGALQLYGVLRLMRRVHFGTMFPEGSAAAGFFAPRNQQAKLLQEGVRNKETSISAELERTSAARARAGVGVAAANEQLAVQEARLSQIMRSQAAFSDEALAQEKRVLAAKEDLTAAQAAEVAAKREQLTLEKLLAQTEVEKAEVAKIRTNAMAAEYAAQRGILLPAGPGGASAAERARLVTGVGNMAWMSAPAFGAATREAETAATRLARGGLVGRAAAGSMRLGRAALGRIGTGIKGFASGLKGMALGLGGMIGPLDLALAAAFLLPPLLDSIGEATDKADDAIKAASGKTKNADQFHRKLEALAKEADDHTITDQLVALFGGHPYSNISNQAAAITEGALAKARAQALVSLSKGETTTQQEVYPEDIKKYADVYRQEFDKGFLTLAEYRKAIRNLLRTAKSHFSGGELAGAQAAIISSSLALKASSYAQLYAIDPKVLLKRAQSYGKVIEADAATQRDLRDFAKLTIAGAAQSLTKSDPEKRGAGIDALQSYADSIQKMAQSERDRALLFARGQGDINRAYDRYIKALSPADARNEIERQLKDARRRLEANQRNQAKLRSGLPPLPNARTIHAHDLGAALSDLSKERKDLQEQLKGSRKDEKRIRDQIEALNRAKRNIVQDLRDAQREARNERFDQRTDYLQALYGYQEAQQPEGLARTMKQIQDINKLIGRAIKRFGRNSKEVLDLLTQREGTRDQLQQYALDTITSKTSLAESSLPTYDEVGRARVRVHGAEQTLAKLRAQGADANKIRDAIAELNNAQNDLNDTLYQQATDLHDAALDIAEARANARSDVVGAARIELRKAVYDLHRARTPVEKAQARQQVIESRANLRDQIAQRQIDTIEFEADIGKLSAEQQIRAYKRILNTLKLSQEMRRDLRRKIYDLQHQLDDNSDFELKVGDIKLPTVYEIRRAIQGGANSSPRVQNFTNAPTYRIYAQGANADEVVRKIKTTNDRDNRALLRSGGYI